MVAAGQAAIQMTGTTQNGQCRGQPRVRRPRAGSPSSA
jgi:hypothetical protein